MRKIFAFLLVALLLAGSAFGLNESNQGGPKNVTSCYIVGAGPVTSGSVVVLQTSSPTYPGAEVTGSVTLGKEIYGVVVDTTNYTAETIADGKWIKVQTYGYCDKVRVDSVGGASLTAGEDIVTGTTRLVGARGTSSSATGNVVAMESATLTSNDSTVGAFLQW